MQTKSLYIFKLYIINDTSGIIKRQLLYRIKNKKLKTTKQTFPSLSFHISYIIWWMQTKSLFILLIYT